MNVSLLEHDPTDHDIYYALGPFTRVYSHNHYEFAPMGLGRSGAPIINMDPFIPQPPEELEREFNDHLPALLLNQWMEPMIHFGLVPAAYNKEKCLDSYLLNLDKYDQPYTSRPYTEKCATYHELKRYYTHRFGITPPWQDVVHLRRVTDYKDRESEGRWLPAIRPLRKLRAYIEQLPFKHIGHAILMRVSGNAGQQIHRDSPHKNTHANHINLTLSGRHRPFFVFDERNWNKTYSYSNAFTFNGSDLHGVDPWPAEELVLRVDGEFQDWLKVQLEMEEGSFNWNYPKPVLQLLQGPIVVDRSTDL